MLESVLKGKLNLLESEGLLKKLKKSILNTSSPEGRKIQTDTGEELTSFSCSDYIGLAAHETVKQAAIDAINAYGVGARASRLATGNHPIYEELETKIAKIYQTEAALVFSSGYLANIGSISALVDESCMVLADQLIHAAAVDGVKLSGAKLHVFAHNDIEDCKVLLKEHRHKYKHCLILTENVCSLDGDLAPVDDLVKLAREHDTWIAIDTAHGFGILGTSKPDLYMGTLSKAAGALGGYICAPRTTIEYLLNKARSFIYTTALPPALIAAANAALDIYTSYAGVPLRLAKEFCQMLELPPPKSHIVPLIMRDSRSAINAEKTLADNGILVTAICPPSVPTPRLKFIFTAAHKLIDIHRLCNILKSCGVLDGSAQPA
ncbi:8-amino-7-oxononanoate synthase [Anaplasma platys]|uniref:8-amino-7-oxononanoate synthase n=1 Tax=Anaplasma platys TaxID=949 RepID=A0A858PYZ2_9RICK|nr:aminotransferase class I/II-fold pyridoxal phosphate-dependent enzyme [Anaplasma platys]QJC27782.1 8-amino-7-oxononanoate synthase [Anaplasma platys]